jgi:ABC-type hemin transport system substrate-binding protein
MKAAPTMKASSDQMPSVSYLQRMIAFAVVVGFLWLLWGPGSPLSRTKPATNDPSISDSASTREEVALTPRVASLSPAITDSLVQLGLAKHIVGRSAYCRAVDANVPVVGDLRDFDAERLALLKPDFLFVQPPLAGVDPALRALCETNHITLLARRLDSLHDLRLLVDDIALAFDVNDETSAQSDIRAAIASAREGLVEPIALTADAPRVLLVVSTDPFLIVGSNTYLDEFMRGSGFANVLQRSGYVELGAEAIVALAPATVIAISSTKDGAVRMSEVLRALPWDAANTPRVSTAAVPELLTPSLVAVAHRDALARLAAGTP